MIAQIKPMIALVLELLAMACMITLFCTDKLARLLMLISLLCIGFAYLLTH